MGAGGFVAGAIVGKLMLDKGGWDSTIKSVSKDEQTFGGMAERMSSKTKAIGTAFTVAGGAIIGALGGMIYKVSETGEELSKLSKQTGISVENLSSLRIAAETNETSLEGIATGMKKLSINMVAADQKGSAMAITFDALGIKTRDANGQMRSMDDVMLDVADVFMGMADGAEKDTLAIKLFGKSGLDLIPMLNTGSAAIKAQMEQAKKLGLVMTKEAAEGADNFGDSVATLKLGLQGATEHLVGSLMPTLSSLVEKITTVVGKVTEWMKANPGLTDTILKIGLAVGGIMLVLGPLLLILPKIVAGFDTLKGLGTGLVGQFKGLGGEVTGLSGVLSKLPLIAAAAFAGWEIGKAIGDIKVLGGTINEHITNAFDAAFKSIGLFNGAAVETGLRNDMIAKATEISGRSVKNLGDAVDILRKQYKDTGDVGIKSALDSYDAWNKEQTGLQGAAVAADTKAKKVVDLNKVMADAKKAAEDQKTAEEAWTNFLKTEGILTLDEKAQKIKTLNEWIDRLDGLYKTGKLSVSDWAAATGKAKEEIGKLTDGVTHLEKPTRNYAGILEGLKPPLEDVGEAVWVDTNNIKYWSDQLGVSEAEVQRMIWNMDALQLSFLGIQLPRIELDAEPMKTATENIGGYWDGLMNDITSSWGGTIQSWLEGTKTFSDFVKETWGDIKTAFFRMVSEMVAKWAVGFIKGIIDPSKEAGTSISENVGGGLKSLGSTVSTVATSIGTILTTLATSVATVITTIGTAIATVITTLATAIATAATTLAAAAEALVVVGALALAFYVAFRLAKGLLDELFGSAPAGEGYWLSKIWALTQGLFNSVALVIEPLLVGDILNTLFDIKEAVIRLNSPLEEAKNHLANISARADDIAGYLKNLPTAQAGRLITEPSLIVAGEQAPRIPEIIAPLPDYIAAIQGGSGPGRSVNVFLSTSFNIDTLDATGVRDIVRSKIGPQIVEWLKANLGKTVLKEALGV
jgi:hypothetical protein